MSHRNKILILENDDFLREIIGNLLHKEGGYILNGFSVQSGIENARNHSITTVILGTSCTDYKGKETLAYLKKELDNPNLEFFVINHQNKKLSFIESDQQMTIDNLSIKKILYAITV